MHEIPQRIEHILRDIDRLRSAALAKDAQNPELRALIRQIIAQMEQLQRGDWFDSRSAALLVALLTRMLDAEHGLLLGNMLRLNDSLNDAEQQRLQRHVEERQKLLQQAMQEIPPAQSHLVTMVGLLGQPLDKGRSHGQLADQVERFLRERLASDTALREEMGRLIGVMQGSMQALEPVLAQTGSSSEELKEALSILEKELPADPRDALAQLRSARQKLISATNSISGNEQQLRSLMQKQMDAIRALSDRLRTAEDEARRDALTGIANRRKLGDYLKGLGERQACFVIVDIDHFKQINDTLGHDAGDGVLAQFGRLLGNSVRGSDLVARLGGEEFCIVLPQALEVGLRVAESVRQAVELHPFSGPDGRVVVTASLGVAERLVGEPYPQWLKRADQALYEAKRSGRNRVISASKTSA